MLAAVLLVMNGAMSAYMVNCSVALAYFVLKRKRLGHVLLIK